MIEKEIPFTSGKNIGIEGMNVINLFREIIAAQCKRRAVIVITIIAQLFPLHQKYRKQSAHKHHSDDDL